MEKPRPESEWESRLMSNKEGLFIQTAGSLTFAPNWAALAGLNKKIAVVMGQLQVVQEDAKHQQGWKYASYGAVVQGVRKALSEQGVGLYANLIHYEQQKQPKGIKSVVEVEFTFADGETGAMRTSRWAGEAADFGVADKGLNKAYTAAEKYFLMRTFLVSTTDDVESDATSQPKITRKASAKSSPSTTKRKTSTQPKPTVRPYTPERVQKGILSRASKGDQTTASEGRRGVVIGYLEAIWTTAMPDVREAKRHAILNFLFGDPSSKQLTKARCDAILQWLTDTQEDGKRVLNAFAISEAVAMVPTSDDLPF